MMHTSHLGLEKQPHILDPATNPPLQIFHSSRPPKIQIGLYRYLWFIFTVLHVMQTRYSDENSVRLSVCHTREL